MADTYHVKDHVVREVVNRLRDTALEFHAHGSLRERLARELEPLLVASRPAEVDDWISVDDRLPPEKRRCLISYESDADGEPCLDVGYGRLDNDGWKHAATFYSLAGAAQGRPFEMRETASVKVLYWKEMPSAPSHTTNKEK